ncbi:TetR/AcrR family transcriptional regulator [Nocardia sp. alder85J]|uniref:TetR/AcrR family transcriptional regulator n=1 Tax=Nocardia sp. alder85J TaxID=2862949 RepID=UPI002102710F|nr:TetR/AcrR family transcriptional regulator [Nocardia sp. alder85J]MCX4094071.1 helix-turn-helix domain containing protein [Nocardia sp. alder85J]
MSSATAGLAARADARRNRALVLAAAQSAFADQGVSVSLAEIARRAGVGAGTVYRHFPTKADLLEAVMQQRIERMTDRATACLSAPDVGAAFFEFCVYTVVSGPRNQAVCDVMTTDDGWPRALMHGAGERFHRALRELLVAAQRHGAVRPDLTLTDLLGIFTGCAAIQRVSGAGPELLRPTRIALDALRPRAGGPVTKPASDAVLRDETRNETDTAHCSECGAALRRRGTGRPARFCSPACRQKGHRRRSARAAQPPAHAEF